MNNDVEKHAPPTLITTKVIEDGITRVLNTFALIVGFLAIVVGICLVAGAPAWATLMAAGFVAMFGGSS